MDNLDTLSDAALSEMFAVEVAKDKPERLAFASRDGGESGCLFEASRRGFNDYGVSRHAIEEHCRKYPEYKVIERDVFHGRYAESADAVLPFIVARGWAEMIQTDLCGTVCTSDNIRWRVRFLPERCGGYAEGEAKTLPRAACIALIRAKRAEKGGIHA